MSKLPLYCDFEVRTLSNSGPGHLERHGRIEKLNSLIDDINFLAEQHGLEFCLVGFERNKWRWASKTRVWSHLKNFGQGQPIENWVEFFREFNALFKSYESNSYGLDDLGYGHFHCTSLEINVTGQPSIVHEDGNWATINIKFIEE